MKKPWDSGTLTVSADGGNLVNGAVPFFWLADTAWDLFQRLNEEEAYVYLKNRREKGFNVIQCVLINFSHDGDKTSRQRVENQDISETIHEDNSMYWDHVKRIVETMESFGMYAALLPCWGKVVEDGHLHENNVAAYADFLINHFKDRKNIIWVLGGDIRGDRHAGLWDTMGTALKSAMPDTLISYHPFGRTSSSYWFTDRAWLDFHMFQSGHRRYDQHTLTSWDDAASSEPWFGEDNWRYVLQDRDRDPARPVVDAEPSYEQIPQGLHNPSEPCWQARHVRRYAYWSVLSGAMGHTYGHNALFQFHGTGYKAEFSVAQTWQEALHASGGSQMQYVKELMEEIDFIKGKPMPCILTPEETGAEKENKIAAFGTDSHIVLYNYSGRSFSIVLRDQPGVYDAYWIDPVNGSRSYAGGVHLHETAVFTPPPKDTDFTDWLLLLTKVS
ncbi:apiosidase-like domain-containing protein [Salibacterium sp. K-3]